MESAQAPLETNPVRCPKCQRFIHGVSTSSVYQVKEHGAVVEYDEPVGGRCWCLRCGHSWEWHT